MRFYLLFILLILSIDLSASNGTRPNDTPCDTIKLVNGSVVLGHIYYEDRGVVKYTHCNDAIKTKDEIPMFQVKEIAYGSDKHNMPAVEERDRLNRRGVYLVVIFGAILVGALIAVLLII